MNRCKVIAVCGPTATGKSELAVELALRFGGEVVNFDSQQFYRGLDIGTAKPTEEEMRGVPHHLFSILDPCEMMSAGRFVTLADNVVSDIRCRSKVPILVGGTGLYLRAFEYGLFEVEVPMELRAKVKAWVAESPVEAYRELRRLDPEYAAKISERDLVRLSRALEVCLATGKPFSEFQRKNSFATKKPRFLLLKLGLILERSELYAKINERVFKMMERGFLEEVKGLLTLGYSENCKAFEAIGYRHLISYLRGKLSLDEAIRLIQRDTRRYAKRQISWFKGDSIIHWFHPKELEKILTLVSAYLSEHSLEAKAWRA